MKLKNILKPFLLLPLLLLSGCKMVVLDPKGIIALEEKHLLLTALGLMLIVVVPVVILTVVIAYKYRASNTNAKYLPDWEHSTKLEFIWWGIPIVIVAILAVMTWITTHQLDPYRPLKAAKKPITIQVVALEWKWLFIYPKQGIATVDYLKFPVNTPVNFLITAYAPMNAFQIPQLGGQIYAMDGMQTKLHLLATHMGNYNGRSVSFSGNGFSKMKFVAHVTTQADFNQWVAKTKADSYRLTIKTFQKLARPSIGTQISYYGNLEHGIYNRILSIYRPHNLHLVEKMHPLVTL